MTNRSVSIAMKKITDAKKLGFHQEAFLRAYHMNLQLMNYLLERAEGKPAEQDKKIKSFRKQFFKTHKHNQALKSAINSQSVKSLDLWLSKTDTYFKNLRKKQPANTRQLLEESTRIAGMLNISLNKVGAAARKKPKAVPI